MGRRQVVDDAALRLFLSALGTGLSVASRRLPSVRSQVTRDLVYEVSAADRIGRQWAFHATGRRITSTPRRVAPASGGLHFADSGLALRRLTSPRAVDEIVEDWHDGRVRVAGPAELLLWFYGLTRCVVRFGGEPGPGGSVPAGGDRPDPLSRGNERLVVEPAVTGLDPAWSAAWRCRALLPNVRATTGEPVEGW